MCNRGDLDLLENVRAKIARALCERLRDVRGIALSVLGKVNAAGCIFNVEVGIVLFNFVGRKLGDLHIEGARHCRQPVEFLKTLGGQREGDRAGMAESRVDAGLLVEI